MVENIIKIFEDGELDEQVVISKMEIATPHGAIQGEMQNFPMVKKNVKCKELHMCSQSGSDYKWKDIYIKLQRKDIR